MQLLLATTNLHKILELKSILKPQFKEIDFFSLKDFPDYKAPEESGSTFGENAEMKALLAAKALGMLTIADDSGLVVPALGGDPGIRSHRYAGDDCTDKDNRDKLIEVLSGLADEERCGYFECALTLASPSGVVRTVHGYCEGSLILEPRGRNGFGYDPIFIKYDYSKTMAELETEVKNRISHRRKAIDKLLLTLEAELSLTTS